MSPDEMRAIRAELKVLRPEFGRRIGCTSRMIKYYEDGHSEIPLRMANSAKWVRHVHRLEVIRKRKVDKENQQD
jgi:DNA-binding transcriptional regulator YiaG